MRWGRDVNYLLFCWWLYFLIAVGTISLINNQYLRPSPPLVATGYHLFSRWQTVLLSDPLGRLSRLLPSVPCVPTLPCYLKIVHFRSVCVPCLETPVICSLDYRFFHDEETFLQMGFGRFPNTTTN